MAYDENCKGCRESVKVSREQIQKMLSEIEENNSFGLVEEVEYLNRLNQCSKCKYIQYENTCTQCGCIVQIRARLASGTCPYPGISRW
jgi:DNA invertase Pin-like site-specific DNA recombinase